LKKGIVEDGYRSSVGPSDLFGVSSVSGMTRSVLRTSGDGGQEGESEHDLGQHCIEYKWGFINVELLYIKNRKGGY